MDPALRDRESFQKRAIAIPKTNKKMPHPTVPKLDSNTYKTMAGSSQHRFGVLTKIVKHMRKRHQNGENHPLTLEEILDETNQLHVGQSVKNWLGTEALMNNHKIEVNPDGTRFSFKPVYKIKNGKSLLRLLKQHDLKGLGGILLEDVQESLPHCDKVLKNRASDITLIVNPINKKKILFYNDRTANLIVDEKFQKLWRSATVDAMDDAKIDEYLEKQGIPSMQDHGPKKPVSKRKKVANKNRQFKKPRYNEHLTDVLETYDYNILT